MAPNKTKWTDDQLRAIETTDRSVMVTASAGTGKTAVLSSRCSNLVAKNKSDVSSLLVLTFTEAAAEEMKTRIASQLKNQYLLNFDPAVKSQILLLDSAQISTIHSFCKTIISENFHKLGIDPGFSILDSDEQKLIKSEILAQLIENAWNEPDLAQGLKELLYRRDASLNAGFISKIISINDFLDSIPNRQFWFSKANEICGNGELITEPVRQMQIELVKSTLSECIEKIKQSIELDSKLADGFWHDQFEIEILQPFENMKKLIESDLEAFIRNTKSFSISFKRKPKDIEPDIKDIVQQPARKAIDDLQELGDLAIINCDYDELISRSASMQTQLLLRLVRDFDILYSQRKRQLNCLDFSDLEHLALQLLSNDDKPSELADELSKKFNFIFVDEYQDINEVQQAILDKIVRVDNVFGVGDVKQSIYAFRQAKPEIFISKIETANTDSKTTKPIERIDLRKNFRSRKNVLDFVNNIFERIMSKDFCGMEYDSSAMLEAGFDYLTQKGPDVELHIIDEKAESDHDNDDSFQASQPDEDVFNWTSKPQRQALLIGRRIKEIVEIEKPQIYDRQTDSYRQASYGDIVILMRSLSSRLNEYIEIFRLLDIPISTTSNTGYFETTEISDCISLLKVIDNPIDDIAVVSVLRSPFFNFNETQLAIIRHFADSNGLTDDNYYTSLQLYKTKGDDQNLKNKIENFFNQLSHWRKLTHRQSLAQLIWDILRFENYISFVSALPNGRQRKQNLLKLHERAIQFESFVTCSHSVSLSRFIDFIEKLLDQGQDWSPAQTPDSVSDGVRLLNVHQSKGLEFPIVFLAQLGSKFNLSDLNDDCLLDSSDTLGLRIINRKTKTKAASAAYQVIKKKILRSSLAEEMRILYVAMTRAREKLILTGNLQTSKAKKILTQCAVSPQSKPPYWLLSQCPNHFEWILYALGNRKKLHQIYDTPIDVQLIEDDLFRAELYQREQIRQLSQQIKDLTFQKNKTDQGNARLKYDIDKIRQNLNYNYPFTCSAKLQSKTSASKIDNQNLPKNSPADDHANFHYHQSLKPLWNDSKEISRAQIGTATHTVLQHLDLDNIVNAESILETIENLKQQKIVTQEISDKINISEIEKFFKSTIGRAAADEKNKVHREWQFTYALDSKYFDNKCEDDFVILQGMIDMLIETPQGLIVIDFKTDNISPQQVPDRAQNYAQQVNLYAKAASDILKTPIIGKWLYFLTPSAAHEII